jgi:hypothetical protein
MACSDVRVMTVLLVWMCVTAVAAVSIVVAITAPGVGDWWRRSRVARRRRDRRDERELLLEDAGGDREALDYATELVDRVSLHDRWLAEYLDLEALLDHYVASAIASARARRLTARLDRESRVRSRATRAEQMVQRRIEARAVTEARLQACNESRMTMIALLEYAAERSGMNR